MTKIVTSFCTALVLAGCVLVEPFDDIAAAGCARCVGIHATSQRCDRGRCELDCMPGFADCNFDGSDGCEADLEQPGSCGGCGKVCRVGDNANGVTCRKAECIPTCNPGWADCDGATFNDGCETNITASLEHCGGCQKRCGDDRSIGSCTDSVCKIACREPFLDCDGKPENGCEIDSSTDPANCNACGRVCGGGCKYRCTPQTLATNLDAAVDIAVGAGFVFYPFASSSGGIARVPINGGQTSGMSTSLGGAAPEQLAISPTELFWWDVNLKAIYKAPLPQGSAQLVLSDQWVGSMAVDAQGLFWSDTLANEIRARDGLGYKTIASAAAGGLGPIAIDGTSVYFVSEQGKKLSKVDRGGGSVTPLYDATVNTIDAIALDATQVYVAQHASAISSAEITWVGKDGSSPPISGIGIGDRVTRLVADVDWIFVTLKEAGRIVRATKAGGGLLNFVENQDGPTAIALDGDHVYWTNAGAAANSGTVMRLEKVP